MRMKNKCSWDNKIFYNISYFIGIFSWIRYFVLVHRYFVLHLWYFFLQTLIYSLQLFLLDI